MKRRAFLGSIVAGLAASVGVRAMPITNDGVSLYGGTAGCAMKPSTRYAMSNVMETPMELSETSLEQLIIEIHEMTDEAGKRICVRPTKIFYPRKFDRGYA